MEAIYQAVSNNSVTFHSPVQKKALQQAIENLPQDQQLILHLHYTDELPVNTIAKQLQLSPSTVYKKINTAVYHLKKQFAPHEFAKADQILYGEIPNRIA